MTISFFCTFLFSVNPTILIFVFTCFFPLIFVVVVVVVIVVVVVVVFFLPIHRLYTWAEEGTSPRYHCGTPSP